MINTTYKIEKQKFEKTKTIKYNNNKNYKNSNDINTTTV
jgi:hypothetical protein